MSWLRDALAGVRPLPDRGLRSGGAGIASRSRRCAASATSRASRRRCSPAGPDCRNRGRKLAITLDEFQAIAAFNGGSVEHALRAAVQQRRDVGYVFSGLGAGADGADARATVRSTRPVR